MRHLLAVAFPTVVTCKKGSSPPQWRRSDSDDSVGALNEDWEGMKAMVEAAGGFVHPAVRLVETNGSGRGIIVDDSVAKDEALMSIPWSLAISGLHLTGAEEGVVGSYPPGFAEVEAAFENPERFAQSSAGTAAWLGIELYNDTSQFAPYFRALRDHPPAHRCDVPPEKAASLTEDELVEHYLNWESEPDKVVNSRSYTEYAQTFKRIRELGLVPELTFKGFAQAFHMLITRSFAFGIKNARFIVPVVDFANHDNHASCYYTRDQEDEYGRWYFSVWTQRDLYPGDEVTFTYGSRANPEMYISYGFSQAVDNEPWHEWIWNEELWSAELDNDDMMYYALGPALSTDPVALARTLTALHELDQNLEVMERDQLPSEALMEKVNPKMVEVADADKDPALNGADGVCAQTKARVREGNRRAVVAFKAAWDTKKYLEAAKKSSVPTVKTVDVADEL